MKEFPHNRQFSHDEENKPLVQKHALHYDKDLLRDPHHSQHRNSRNTVPFRQGEFYEYDDILETNELNPERESNRKRSHRPHNRHEQSVKLS